MDRINIVPYDPHWPERFQKLGSRLRNSLGSTAIQIHHIGSTSVPGLDAKPIIDVQISVQSLEDIDLFRIPLEEAGFVYRAENTDLTKRYFREVPGTRRTHIHVRQAGSWSEQFALLFRDYLRNHEAACRIYAHAKYGWATQYAEERGRYTEAKRPLIWELMQQADAWSQSRGWKVPASDA